MRAMLHALLLSGLILTAAVAGCGGDGEKAAAPGEWKMVLNHNGESITLALDMMNVFLVEDESYPEYFAISGAGVVLGGDFPEGVHVGYEEEWSRLFGKAIVISPRGGDPREPQDSYVELASGVRSRVAGGTIVFEKVTGTSSGSEGDMTLSGRIMLMVETDAGIENVMGIISVHCVTWG